MAFQIGLKPLSEMCRRVATSYATGIDARTMWSREARTGPSRKQREFEKVSQAISAGSTVTEALQRTEGYLPQLVIDMTHVGEQSGNLDQSLERLADYYERVIRLRRIFLTAIIWPVIQLIGAVCAIGFVIWVTGFIGGKQTGPDAIDTDIVGFGLQGSRGLAIYCGIVGAIAVVGFLLIRSLMGGVLSKIAMVPIMKIPAIGPALRTLAISRLAWALGMTFESGMSAKKCVTVAMRSTQNRYFTRHIQDVNKRVTRGETLHEAFQQTGAFPQDFLDAVMVGEESGRIGESMERISQAYESKAQLAMKTLTIAAGFAVWCIIGLFIVFMIIRIALFYRDLIIGISNW